MGGEPVAEPRELDIPDDVSLQAFWEVSEIDLRCF